MEDAYSSDQEALRFDGEEYEIVADLIKNHHPEKVLDVGTATGFIWEHFTPDLVKQGKVYGVDIEPTLLRKAEERGIQTSLCNFDTEPLPYADGTFDSVVLSSILEHTLKPRELVREIHRVLKPNGQLIITVPNAVSMIKRWELLRGRSSYHAMIDNLVNKEYLERCSIFYDRNDLEMVMNNLFLIQQIQYLDKPARDPKSWSRALNRMISRRYVTLRDEIIVDAKKT